MVPVQSITLMIVFLSFKSIGGKRAGLFSKANVSCFDELMQSTKPNSLMECCGHCLSITTCEAIKFENGICNLYSNLLCCREEEEEKELFVDDATKQKLLVRKNSPCK